MIITFKMSQTVKLIRLVWRHEALVRYISKIVARLEYY